MSTLRAINKVLKEQPFLQELFGEDTYEGKPALVYEEDTALFAISYRPYSGDTIFVACDYDTNIETVFIVSEDENDLPDLCENIIFSLYWWVQNNRLSSDTKQLVNSLIKEGKKRSLLNVDYDPIID